MGRNSCFGGARWLPMELLELARPGSDPGHVLAQVTAPLALHRPGRLSEGDLDRPLGAVAPDPGDEQRARVGPALALE